MPTLRSVAVKFAASLCISSCSLIAGRALGQDMSGKVMPQNIKAQDLYLEVFINDVSTGMIGAFKQMPDGGLSVRPEELREVGMAPDPGALGTDGSIRVDRLPNVQYRVDNETQRLYISTIDKARAAKIIDIGPKPRADLQEPQSSYGVVLNYSLFASTPNLVERNIKVFQGISGDFDARFFSPFGTLNQSFAANTSEDDIEGVRRLNTTWGYSDPERLMTYRAGDFVTGGLPWTRPIFLGGMQIQRNFSLRSDLVTLPIPILAGTAAVPSTLEVYTQNVKSYSGTVPSGPFEVTNFPVFSGQGKAEIVLKDALGRETRTALPFYSSSRLIRQGLLDFSTEIGFPRRNYASQADDYDGGFMGEVTARYGITNWLTLEGHFEGGADLLNGGIGTVFPLSAYGVASVAASGSSHDGSRGALLDGSVELAQGSYTLVARLQHAFGDYDDIASVSAEVPTFGAASLGARVPRTLAQMSVFMPGPFDRSNLSFSYAQQSLDSGGNSKIVGVSYGQSFFKSSSLYATAFADLEGRDSFGVFAGVTIPLDHDINISTGYEQTSDGPTSFVDIAKSEQQEVGSYGWHLRTSEGSKPDRSAAVSYRGRYARVEGSVQQVDGGVHANGQVDGAIAVAAGGVFATNRIDDAFAVVDVGEPGVDVLYENRPAGRTNGSGRLLVPNLRSYEPNTVAIDPRSLPIDASIDSTRDIVVPAGHSGVVVDFNVANTPGALVSLVDSGGKALETGLRGHVEGSAKEFVVGYGGDAYIQVLAAQNSVVVDLLDGKSCRAQFAYKPQPGTQVKIGKAVCS
ncbi:fimbrial biogenesis outer membrane usher protein [Phyllobacterium endophyticum]|nr:fimbrial biogenesis outer membrane usher protein [Phyllobacterium endophyticum]